MMEETEQKGYYRARENSGMGDKAAGEWVQAKAIVRTRHGRCDAAMMVEAARSERSRVGRLVHDLFNWDDFNAAEAYRREQARHYDQSVVYVIEEAGDDGEAEVTIFPAFWNIPKYDDEGKRVGHDGVPMVEVLSNEDIARQAQVELFKDVYGYHRRLVIYPVFNQLVAELDRLSNALSSG